MRNLLDNFKVFSRKIIWVLTGVIAVVSLYLIIILLFWLTSRDKIYPGVSVAGISLSGKSKSEAEAILKPKVDEYLAGKISISSEKSQLVSFSELGAKIDIQKTVEQAQKIGAENPFILGFKKNESFWVSFSGEGLKNTIASQEKETNKEIINSKLEKSGGEIKVIEGKSGKRVNFSETAWNIKNAVSNLENKADVAVFEIRPTFGEADLIARLPEIKEKSKNPISLLSGKEIAAKVEPETIISWVEIPTDQRSMAEFFEGDRFFEPLYVTSSDKKTIFSSGLISNYLIDLSKKVDRDPVNAQLTVSGGKAVIFVPSQNGQMLDVGKSITEIIKVLDDGKSLEASLVVEIKKPEIREDSLNTLGITELLSTGSSNFAGSPTNRRHNIKTGASKFNGVLIKPGETFSFNTTLGPVDASTGYLPELVIKENKTVPEYGGGMCQVSSTAFRAALNGGLPILERTYHAYPVVYYKPYGVDATVYLPKPDLVFKNDTGKYILIQTRISGNNLYFDFYGTKPARTIKFGGSENGAGAVFPVEQVNPLIYDQGVRGNGSFTAVVWRFIYDATGKITDTDKFVSKYDSPDKYPH